ncbi:MAG: MarR family winged helix-turn-helix transcriptional regulator [Thalassobaculaceae bacterium]
MSISSVEPKSAPLDAAQAAWRNDDLSMRPGVLIRQLHQMHTALFLKFCGHENITPVMYSVLSCLAQRGPMDQTRLAKAVAIDRTNITDILDRLKKRGLIVRQVAPTDRRMRVTALTEQGVALLERVDPLAFAAHAQTLECLPAAERERFIALMVKVTQSRTSMRG